MSHAKRASNQRSRAKAVTVGSRWSLVAGRWRIRGSHWARLAADQGFAIAQYYLGLAYGDGQSVSQDFVQSYMWFELSAGIAIKMQY